MAGLTNYIFRGAFEECFSLSRPRATFTESARLHLQKSAHAMLLGEVETPSPGREPAGWGIHPSPYQGTGVWFGPPRGL